MKKILQRERISWKCLLNHCLFNGSIPLHRKTPSDRDVLLNLYHSTAQLWSYKCLLGTPSSHNNHYSRHSRITGAILNTALVPGRHWQGGWADTSAAFVIHNDTVESPQRVHPELQTVFEITDCSHQPSPAKATMTPCPPVPHPHVL